MNRGIPTDVVDYISADRPPLEFCIGGRLLPKHGKMEICGAPGVMKSWLAQYLSYCLAAGIPWLDFPTIQSRTVLIHFEMADEIAAERASAMSRVIEVERNKLFLWTPGVMALERDEDFNQLKATLQLIEPQVVVLDYFRCCYGLDENKSQEVNLWTGKIESLIRELNLAVIVLHHTNKNPLYSAGMDKSSGSTALPGWMDTVIYIASQPTGTQLQFSKTRHSREPMHSINVAFENYVWRRQ